MTASSFRRNVLRLAAVGVGGGIFGVGMYYRRLAQNRAVTADSFNYSTANSGPLEQHLKRLPNLTLQKKGDSPLEDHIRLFRYTTCPFCGIAKAALDFFQVPHECVEVEPMFKSQIRGYAYTKVPIMAFKDATGSIPDAHLVDSAYIIDAVAKAHGAGSQLEDEDVKKWRQWASTLIVKLLVVNLNASLGNAWSCFEYVDSHADTISWPNRMFLKVMGAPIMYMVAEYKIMPLLKDMKVLTADSDRTKVLLDELDKFASEGLKKRPFHGGSEPDVADLVTYGALQSMRGHPLYDIIAQRKDNVVSSWLERMDKTIDERTHS